MRNIFDQYEQPENRLTHAVVCCLAEDPKLLRRFVRWAVNRRIPAGGRVEILEQQLPGDAEVTERDADQRGLPDAWIGDREHWGLIIEAKVASAVKIDQLRRHLRTVERRGLGDVNLLVISLTKPAAKLPLSVHHKTWSQIYTWSKQQARGSAWARRIADYMEAAEGRMVEAEYLEEGTLTVFSGIPFCVDNPYNYREAKRVLGLAMNQLRVRKDLQKELRVDPERKGRPAITGKDLAGVWDLLWLKKASGDKFTKCPHLTLSIQTEHVFAITIIPNGMERAFRRNLTHLTEGMFCELIRDVAGRLDRALRNVEGAKPWLEVLQRHYPTQRSAGIVDARLAYDLRTILRPARGTRRQKIRYQPEWIEATYKAFMHKKSNMQLGIGAIFPYRTCPLIQTAQATELFANTWLCCKPILEVLLGDL